MVLSDALSGKSRQSLEQTNSILDYFIHIYQADACYLIDTNGITIASSNRKAQDSFVGQNYAFRPYFQKAIRGDPETFMGYMALGVTSGRRGIYYSHSVYYSDTVYKDENETPIGVAVVKAPIDPLEKAFIKEYDGIVMLTDPNGIVFISNRNDGPACLVLDVRMPGMSGIKLQEKLARDDFNIPIIFISGHGNISMSVKAMKAGAVDFIEKPFEDQKLIDAINKALEKDKKDRVIRAESKALQGRIELLTPREHEVFTLVVSGRLNKQIASDLGMSEKTVKVHRARVMTKMKAKSLAELVLMAERAGLFQG